MELFFADADCVSQTLVRYSRVTLMRPDVVMRREEVGFKPRPVVAPHIFAGRGKFVLEIAVEVHDWHTEAQHAGKAESGPAYIRRGSNCENEQLPPRVCP